MGSPTEYEMKRTLPRIEAILSVEEDRKGELRSWIRQRKFEDDLASFYTISESATHKLNAQWTKAILAALPDKFYSMSEEGVPQLDQIGSAASLRLLSSVWDGAEQQESVLHQAARKEVMQALFDHIPDADRGAYRDMLSWADSTESEKSEVPGDTRFAQVLGELERMMESMVAEQELQWRRHSTLDDRQPTPVDVRENFSVIALQKIFSFMGLCWEYGRNTYKLPDSLLALLSVNMSCNKTVLEYAAMNYRSHEAMEMTVSFLRELNIRGIWEVPIAFEGLSPTECDSAIFNTFQTWFGYKGDFIRPGQAFAKHMTKSDIQVLVELSRQLQAEYLTTRGSTPISSRNQTQEVHGGSFNRFIFALVLAAAFYSKASTDKEFVVGKNASYAIFPDRKSIKQGHLLTIHAKDALLKAYGLVFFGNSGSNLLPDGIKQYGRLTELRRLHKQVVILCAVKGRSLVELMGLFENLQQLKVNHNLVLERLGLTAKT